VKSDKEAAANELKMGAQTQPTTIIEQREQELMGINKQELMASMAPTLERTGRESMRPPQGGMHPPQGQNPANSGIAAMAPKMSFSGGGIVSYAEGGGPVTETPLFGPKENAPAAFESKWADMGLDGIIRSMLSKGKTPEEIALMLDYKPEALALIEKIAGRKVAPTINPSPAMAPPTIGYTPPPAPEGSSPTLASMTPPAYVAPPVPAYTPPMPSGPALASAPPPALAPPQMPE